MMRPAAAALLLLACTGLPSCAERGAGPEEPVREDHALYEDNVRDWVEAMEMGMARARRSLALRALRRMIEPPG